VGCRFSRPDYVADEIGSYRDYLTTIEYPEVDQASFESAQVALANRPPTVSEFQELDFEDLTIEQAIERALTNSSILSKMGGQVIAAPSAAASIFDPAVQETSPFGGVEGALSAFDARWDTSFNFNRGEQKFNNSFLSLGSGQITNRSSFISGISKRSVNGATYGFRNTINYNRNNSPANRFGSSYDMIVQAEYRQALLRGAGSLVNRIAGPNATPGVYNGVLISKINQDITLADFEISVRNLVRDVERSYWELYYAYRNLDNLIDARDSARDTWQKREQRKKIDRPDDEAQARQLYFSFKGRVQDALAGVGPSLGVYGAERELRRLCGFSAADGSLLRPVSDPVIAQINYDWDTLQLGAMEKRVELRRQQWTVQQRELEFLAAKNLNRWQLDFVANYGWRGFGDNLAGSRSRADGSALEDLWSGDLDDWNMGFEFGGPIGKRQTFLAVRNSELQLSKSRAVLREQQRQVVLDLNRAFTEVDRAFEGIENNYNLREAVKDELRPKQRRYDLGAGDDDIFFLLDAQQRAANVESAFIRSIVDYNLALLDTTFQAGRMLERYDIHLLEGPWGEDAIANASARDLKYSSQ
jgi:outer membrane protein TolC